MKPKNNRIFCVGCNHSKMLFESKRKADDFLRYNSQEIASGSRKVPTRSYYCSFCCGWHVTSVGSEEEARKRDDRDEKMWEAIKRDKENRRSKRVRNDEHQQSKPQQPKRPRYPLTEQGNELLNMSLDITILFNGIVSAMLDVKYDRATELVERARGIYEEMRSKGAEYDIDCKITDKRGRRLDEFGRKLDMLKGLVGQPELRRQMINELSHTKAEKNTLTMVRNLDGVERMEQMIAEAERAKAREDVKELRVRMRSILDGGLENFSGLRKREFAERFEKACGESLQQSDAWYKRLLVRAIEHIERAHGLLEQGDADGCREALMKAEETLPGVDDENTAILLEHIDRLWEACG